MKARDANRGIIVGVTGGIACGKSTVTQLLAEKGATPINVDEIGHQLLRRGSPVMAELIRSFGAAILDESGDVSRKKLGAIVFTDKSARERLNAIMHPRIFQQSRSEARRLVAEDPNRVVLIDAALLIEVGGQDTVDVIVVVTASPKVQLQRLLNRSTAQNRPLSQAEAQARIDSQMPLSEKIKYADFVIENNSTIEELRQKVDALWKELRIMLGCPSRRSEPEMQ
jgi:dephospho-CoA kinase